MKTSCNKGLSVCCSENDPNRSGNHYGFVLSKQCNAYEIMSKRLVSSKLHIDRKLISVHSRQYIDHIAVRMCQNTHGFQRSRRSFRPYHKCHDMVRTR